jgi:hypothetical protein
MGEQILETVEDHTKVNKRWRTQFAVLAGILIFLVGMDLTFSVFDAAYRWGGLSRFDRATIFLYEGNASQTDVETLAKKVEEQRTWIQENKTWIDKNRNFIEEIATNTNIILLPQKSGVNLNKDSDKLLIEKYNEKQADK